MNQDQKKYGIDKVYTPSSLTTHKTYHVLWENLVYTLET